MKKNNKTHKTQLQLLLIFLMILLSGCSVFQSSEPVSKTGYALNTVITITVYRPSEAPLLDQCLNLCKDYENMFSKSISSSDIGRINAAAGRPVKVSDETIELLNQAIHYSELSNGLFDVTIEAVNSLWDFNSEAAAENAAMPPSRAAIDAALPHVDFRNIQISGNTVTLLDPDASIDLGGIAKGYIADRLKEFLLEQGVRSAIIDLGGNILTIGHKPDGSPYHVGIKRPFDQNGDIITSVSIADQSVVTSGTYERYFTYQGKMYHHILSPSTGYPADNDLNSVSIIAASSVDCDALSTICLLSGLNDGMQLIESLPNTEAIFITKDGRLHSTNKLSQ